MSVTDNRPTKIGQRVQEVFADSRGWVVGLNFRTDEPSALVDWDDKPVDDEDRVFPLDALRVVEVIRLDADHYAYPGHSPLVQLVSQAGEGVENARYTFVNGAVAKGIDAARIELLKQSASGWDD